ELLEDGLEREVAVGEVLVAGRGGDERGQEAGLALVVAALGDLLGELGLDALARVGQRVLTEVAQGDRDLEPPEHERRELGGHQAGADDPDLADGPRVGGRFAGRVLGPALDQVEGVERGLRLAAGEQLADRLFLRAVALSGWTLEEGYRAEEEAGLS